MMGSTEAEREQAAALCQLAIVDEDLLCMADWFIDEDPLSEQQISAFWIDRYEVTRGQYDACVADGVCSEADPSELSTEPDQPVNRVRSSWRRITASGVARACPPRPNGNTPRAARMA